jgi:hypothetical protein
MLHFNRENSYISKINITQLVTDIITKLSTHSRFIKINNTKKRVPDVIAAQVIFKKRNIYSMQI